MPLGTYERVQQRSYHLISGTNTHQLVAAVVTLALIAVSIIGFGLILALKSPPESESLGIETNLHDSVTVYRNEFGIPHIIARNDEDAFFTLGYLHAYDRLWQMDLLRRIARGQLCEILGEAFLPTDAFFRTLQLGRLADSILLPALSSDSRSVLRAYTAGINTFLSHHHNELPFEFGALGYSPQAWTEADCLVIGRLLAFDLSMSFWVDIVLGEVAEYYGIERALSLIPGYPKFAPTVLGQQRNTQHADSNTAMLFRHAALTYLCVREQIGSPALGNGSNSWAIRTGPNQRDAVLANDPHLVLALPARWYQVHISSPTYNVIGATIPGLPGVLIGRNNNVAWGITNVMLDDCDYFIELQDSARPGYVRVGSERTKLTVRVDTIAIRNGRKHLIAVRSVKGRPIISDAHPTAVYDTLIRFPRLHAQPLVSRYLLSLAWTGYQPSDEIRALLTIMRARSWHQFTSALKTWNAPALNFTYADGAGNIGMQPAGFIPLRSAGHPNLPRAGWDTTYLWKSVLRLPFPGMYNPQSGFVASANNKTADSLPFFVSNLWEPSSRAERITELLSLYTNYTERDAQLMQLDLLSSYARMICSIAIPVLDRAVFDSLDSQARQLMKMWDYYLLPSSPAAALYSVFIERLCMLTFCMHLRQDMYHRYTFFTAFPLRRLQECIHEPTSWFAEDSAHAVRLRDTVIVAAFRQAVRYLSKTLSSNPMQWRWSQLHQLSLEHPLAVVGAYRGILSRTADNLGGDATTIANTLWRLYKPFKVIVGASLRFVTRLRDSLAYTIVPGGISGNPLKSSFADQLTLWENGGLLPIPLSLTPASGWKLSIVLHPTARASQ